MRPVGGQQRVLNQRGPLLERGRDPSARNPAVFLKNPHVFIYFLGFRSRKDAKSGPAGFILPVRPKNSPQEKGELPATLRKPGVFQKKKMPLGLTGTIPCVSVAEMLVERE